MGENQFEVPQWMLCSEYVHQNIACPAETPEAVSFGTSCVYIFFYFFFLLIVSAFVLLPFFVRGSSLPWALTARMVSQLFAFIIIILLTTPSIILFSAGDRKIQELVLALAIQAKGKRTKRVSITG